MSKDETIGKIVTKDTIHRLLKDIKSIIKNPLTENGIYYVFNAQAYIWKRASDLKSSYQVVPHLNTYIKNGSVNADKVFVINLTNAPRAITDTNQYPYIIDTDPIDRKSTRLNSSQLT